MRRASAASPSPIRAMTCPGTDVARKLIILGREMGLPLELKDVKVESLVPPELAGDIDRGVHDAACRATMPPCAARLERRARARQGAALHRQAHRRRARPPSGCRSSTRGIPSPTSRSPTTSCASPRGAIATIRSSCRDRAPGPEVTAGGRVRRPAAPGGLPRGAAVSGAHARRGPRAFAPASVGNVAIGFDILGFAVDALGDRVTVTRRAAPGVEISAVRGIAGELPREAARQHRRAGAARDAGGACAPASASCWRSTRAFRSARASAARRPPRWRAVVAANALLPTAVRAARAAASSPWPGRRWRAARGMRTTSRPSLYGGLVLTVGIDHPRVKQIPVPRGHPRGDRASAHVPRDRQGTRDTQAERRAVGFRLADGESRRLHLRLLHRRSRHDPRLLRGRGDRAAARRR